MNATLTNGEAPYSINWDFGDGSLNVSGEAVSHTYLVPGLYLMGGEASDALGVSSRISLPVTVYSGLVLTAVAAPLQGRAPLNVSFSAGGSGGASPYNISWSLSPGVTIAAPSTNYTFDSPGSYSAIVQMSDSVGGEVSKSFVIVVAAPLPGPGPLGTCSLCQSIDWHRPLLRPIQSLGLRRWSHSTI